MRTENLIREGRKVHFMYLQEITGHKNNRVYRKVDDVKLNSSCVCTIVHHYCAAEQYTNYSYYFTIFKGYHQTTHHTI